MRQRLLLLLFTQLMGYTIYSQNGIKAVNDYRLTQERKWLDEYMEFLRFPNVYGDNR